MCTTTWLVYRTSCVRVPSAPAAPTTALRTSAPARCCCHQTYIGDDGGGGAVGDAMYAFESLSGVLFVVDYTRCHPPLGAFDGYS